MQLTEVEKTVLLDVLSSDRNRTRRRGAKATTTRGRTCLVLREECLSELITKVIEQDEEVRT
jgi:hypothetical protein